MGIKRLDWDSHFFGFEVGELNTESHLYEVENFDLILLKQNVEVRIHVQGYENTFQETKVVFNKILNPSQQNFIDSCLIDYDDTPIDNASLYPLAFESGKYSRFKMDSHFNVDLFELLYSTWVDNSLSKEFADKVYYIKTTDEVIGFVTVKNNKEFSTIGLLAVSQNYQGIGIGRKLVLKVEEYCISQNIFELRIPTQKENRPACEFYCKMGYCVKEEVIIKHYWKYDTIQ